MSLRNLISKEILQPTMSNLINKLSEKLGDKNEKSEDQHLSSSGSGGRNSGFDNSDDYSEQTQQRGMGGSLGGQNTRMGGQSRSRQTRSGGGMRDDVEDFEDNIDKTMKGETGRNDEAGDWQSNHESMKFQKDSSKSGSGYRDE